MQQEIVGPIPANSLLRIPTKSPFDRGFRSLAPEKKRVDSHDVLRAIVPAMLSQKTPRSRCRSCSFSLRLACGMATLFLVFARIPTTFAQEPPTTQMWVTTDRADRRTCASIECGTVGDLFYREAASVFETKAGWARVTKYYPALCTGGRFEYVKSGKADCTPANGITDGKVAEWVRLDRLSRNRPADPAAGAQGVAALVGNSDDFHRYKSAFVKAAEKLLSSGECSEKDFKDIGGWMKSTNKGAGIYFTYCGGGSLRIYLDVSNGRTFR